jgi:hypothetical protein
MATTRIHGPPDTAPTFVKAIIFAWVLVVGSENIKVEFLPYADWLATIPALVCLLRYGRPKVTLPQVVFLTTIAIGGFIGGDIAHALVWCVKLAVIFLCTSCLVTAPGLPDVAFRALIALLACNFLMLVLGLLGVSALSEMMGAQERYGTVLSHPGALWHVGIFPLAYFTCLALRGGKWFLWALPGVVACLTLIWLDGSRTAWILVAGFCAVPLVSFLKRVPYLVCGLIILALSLLPVLRALEVSQESSLYRMVQLFQDTSSWTESLETWDSSRYEMTRRSLDLIGAAPLLGNGFHAATIRVDEGVEIDQDTMVVHNAYLQLWADFGLAGFLSFFGVIWGWAPAAKNAYRDSAVRGIEDRAKQVNALFMLVAFGVALLFHPVSTAWSDWILFAVPLAMVARSPGREPCPAAHNIPRMLPWATT